MNEYRLSQDSTCPVSKLASCTWLLAKRKARAAAFQLLVRAFLYFDVYEPNRVVGLFRVISSDNSRLFVWECFARLGWDGRQLAG
jgi:hypothetical protein